VTGNRVRQRLSEDVRRAQIMRAATAVVAEAGFEGASLARIAERAEVSKGLVSHYFTDKDGLLADTVRATMIALRDALAESLVLTDPVPEVVRAAIHRVADLHTTHRAELTAVSQIISNLRKPDGSQRFSLADYDEIYQGEEALFRRGQAEGTLRPFDTRVMAMTYQGALDTMLGYLAENPAADPTAYADALADLLITAIRA
jgi:AcrR family transcriptional regulator